MPALIPQGAPQWASGGGGTSTPVWPTGYTPAAGDRAYIYSDVYESSATFNFPAGWTQPPAVANPPTKLQAFCYKDLVGGDTLPACTWTNGFKTRSIVVVTRGDHAPIANCVEIGALRSTSSTQVIGSGGCTISNDNDFLFFLGYRHKTATADGETVGNLTHFAPFVAADVPAGSSIVSTINYWQQTTKTSTTLDAQSLSKADTNDICNGWTIAFKTQAAASAGFATQPTVQSATAIPNGQYTLSYTPTGGAGTFYAVAVAAGSAVPSDVQIIAGEDSTGAAALAAMSSASTGSASTAILGGSLGNPLYDIHCVYVTSVHSAVVSLLGQFLLATAGREFVVVTGAPAAGTVSILSGASPPSVAGDVIENDQFTQPGNFALNITGTGAPQYSGDGTRQSFSYRIFQVSSATWSPLVTGFVNDSPPFFIGGLGPLAFDLNEVLTPIPLGSLWTSATNDPIAVSATAGLPPGIVITGNALAGAGTAAGVYPVQLSGQDLAGNATPGTLTVLVGNILVPAPLVGLQRDDAVAALLAALFVPQVVLVPDVAPVGQVVRTSPAEGTAAKGLSTVVLAVSTGEAPPAPPVAPTPPGIPNPPTPPIQQPGSIVSRSSNAGVELQLSDLFQYWGDDLSLSNTQDLLLVSGSLYGQQRVLRRLLTNPGDYVFHPDYGAGLPQFVGQTTDIAAISTLIRTQILLEDVVAKDPAPVITVTNTATSADANAIAVTIAYTDAPSGLPQTLSFSLTKTLQ